MGRVDVRCDVGTVVVGVMGSGGVMSVVVVLSVKWHNRNNSNSSNNMNGNTNNNTRR